jgi:hypothetical protein
VEYIVKDGFRRIAIKFQENEADEAEYYRNRTIRPFLAQANQRKPKYDKEHSPMFSILKALELACH